MIIKYYLSKLLKKYKYHMTMQNFLSFMKIAITTFWHFTLEKGTNTTTHMYI